MILDDAERRWIKLKWAEIRKAQALADASNSKWKSVNAEINAYLDAHNILDVVERDRTKRESLALKEALSAGRWHADNAVRHIHDVNLFLRMRELGVM
jgi:predicted 2-oxoglutarate/Fe(II)-dependent dioxygenase YbiX